MASNTTQLTMSSLIEETLDELYRTSERPRQAVLAEALDISETGVDVAAFTADKLGATDIMEVDRELMLVTAVVSTTATVSRAYGGSTAATHANGAVGSVNPDYPRIQVDRAVRRCFNQLNASLPKIVSEVYPAASAYGQSAMVPLDKATMKVLDVRVSFDTTTLEKVTKLNGQWRFEDWLPNEISNTGKALVIPSGYRDKELIVTTQEAYSWTPTTGGEAATIDIPVGGDDLAPLYAAATLATGREMSRREFDQIEEFNQWESGRRNADVRLLQFYWGRFYQRLDEVKSTQNAPRHRPYVRMSSGRR